MENKLIDKLIEQQEQIKAMQENEDSAIKVMRMYEECKKRIDKAIEFIEADYINGRCNGLTWIEVRQLLDILKGSDKE